MDRGDLESDARLFEGIARLRYCYAVNSARRNEAMGQEVYKGLTAHHSNGLLDWTGVVRTLPERLHIPLKRKTTTTYFVDSMSDLFHEDVPFHFIDDVFAVMAATPWHTYQVLTKRPERMLAYLSEEDRDEAVGWAAHRLYEKGMPGIGDWGVAQNLIHRQGYRPGQPLVNAVHIAGQPRWPLPNVWLGVSVEDQQRADERIPLLLDTPAAVRFLSCEPLLGPLRLDSRNLVADETYWDYLRGERGATVQHLAVRPDKTAHIDWVIVGGESGPKARPFNLKWARQLIRQCREASVPVFVKQLGAKPHHPEDERSLPGYPVMLDDRKGGDPDEWPKDLRVREFPSSKPATGILGGLDDAAVVMDDNPRGDDLPGR